MDNFDKCFDKVLQKFKILKNILINFQKIWKIKKSLDDFSKQFKIFKYRQDYQNIKN